MKKSSYILLLTLILSFIDCYATTPIETLNYVISYKWGLIHKDSGDAKITVTPTKDGYELKLTGMTRPWADRLYKVRDTLISNVSKDRYLPSHYSKIAHENKKYSRDDISFSKSGGKTIGQSKKVRENKDGTFRIAEQELEGEGAVYDMLSVFFFLRNIDFASLAAGERVKTTLFSGTMVEQLTVKCLGKEKIKLKDKTQEEAWHIVFNFTSGGGKKSSDDIDCWISADSRHIPLLVVGSLPVGQVRCTYVP